MTLGEVQIIMEELNRHVNDRTQLFMGIGVDPRMGNRLSVSILSSLGEETKRSKVQPIPRRSDDLLERNSESLSDLASPEPKPSRSRLRAAAEPIPAQGPVAEAPPQKIVAPTPVQPVEQPIEQVFAQEGERSQRVPKPDPKPKPPPTKKPEAKQETLQFEPVSRGRFEKSEPTIIDGQDLDVPTFLRKGVPKNR